MLVHSVPAGGSHGQWRGRACVSLRATLATPGRHQWQSCTVTTGLLLDWGGDRSVHIMARLFSVLIGMAVRRWR